MTSFKNRFIHMVSPLATLGIDNPPPPQTTALEDFISRCRSLDKPRVLELGVKRSIASISTRHDDWVPNASEFLGTDIEAGVDVDIVADVHKLTEVTGEEQFDIIISCSSFEHFKYPHLAAHEIMKSLRVGGILFVQTHQSYPLHAFPYDYFRFSKEALAGVFGTKMGVKPLGAGYQFPVRLYSARVPECAVHAAYLNTIFYGEKVSKTPAQYIYEFDV